MTDQFQITFSLDEIKDVARKILARPLKKVITFHAEMGVGKTTLIKALAAQLGVKDMTSSPTFSLVNEYETADGETVYHFDLYRLNSEEEAYDMGIDEYFYCRKLVFYRMAGKNTQPDSSGSRVNSYKTVAKRKSNFDS